jgi:hypothetical protein
MAIESGFVLPGQVPLSEICKPLALELSRCFWLVDVQSGLFRSRFDLTEDLVERLSWPHPATEQSSTRGLRPGSIPHLAPHLKVDEWSYYFAIDTAEEEAFERVWKLAPRVGDLSEAFLEHLDELADLFIMHVDGWWEMYSGRPDWIRRLRDAWPDLQERPLCLAGVSPWANPAGSDRRI